MYPETYPLIYSRHISQDYQAANVCSYFRLCMCTYTFHIISYNHMSMYVYIYTYTPTIQTATISYLCSSEIQPEWNASCNPSTIGTSYNIHCVSIIGRCGCQPWIDGDSRSQQHVEIWPTQREKFSAEWSKWKQKKISVTLQ